MGYIETSLQDYFTAHPQLEYVFFGGKGGVGKTVFAAATAIALARQGRRTLLASTNPVHSLSNLLGQDVLGRHVAVEGAPNLWAYEIDTRETIARSKAEIRDKIQWFLKFADISTRADEFVESATMNPAFEESAMFENMIDLMFKNEYDVYVFDTAPTANARRLLGMSKVYSLWVNKMMQSREEARSLRELLSFTKKKESDPLMDYLVSFRERMEHARVLLTDPARGAPHRGDHALHPVVPGLRDPGGRRGREHAHRPDERRGRRGRVREEPRRDAGRAHGGDLGEVRRRRPGGGAALRDRGPRREDAGPPRRGAVLPRYTGSGGAGATAFLTTATS
jgi:cellulose biosynthesis protein BcsQ